MTTEPQAAAAEIEMNTQAEPAALSSDEVEDALAYITPHPENHSAISLSANKLRAYGQTLRAHLAALEAEVKRKDAWLNRAENELEKIELIKSTGMSFKGEMQYYVNLALLAVQAALAQTDGKAGE